MILSVPRAANILTGMGKAHGSVVDSWFADFADIDGGKIYFCVYWGVGGCKCVLC